MIIKGWQKTSLIDYKDKIATTIFVAGCNFFCPYCHNADLLTGQAALKRIEEEEVINYIEKKEKLLDALCVSGGEPTLYEDLPEFLKKVRKICKNEEKRFLIKLDTNGTNSDMLALLLKEHLIDYVAMDVKTSFENYEKTTRCNEKDLEHIRKSIELLKRKVIDCEFRTTVSKTFVTEGDMEKIGELLKGTTNYFIQQYRYSDKQLEDQDFIAYSKEELLNLKQIAEKWIGQVEIRNE